MLSIQLMEKFTQKLNVPNQMSNPLDKDVVRPYSGIGKMY